MALIRRLVRDTESCLDKLLGNTEVNPKLNTWEVNTRNFFFTSLDWKSHYNVHINLHDIAVKNYCKREHIAVSLVLKHLLLYNFGVTYKFNTF